MYSLTELKKDTLIQLESIPYRITESQHTKLGRGGAIVRTKVKNLLDGSTKQQTFKGSDKVEPASVTTVDMQFLYHEGQNLVLMDLKTYDQQTITRQIVGAPAHYLQEGTQLKALVYKNQVIGVEVP